MIECRTFKDRGLGEFPREVFDQAETLELLDLSGNCLDRLPDDLPRLHRLKILFASDNCFTALPEVLGAMPALRMIGLRSNGLREVPAAALPPTLRWLVLTGNAIEELPESIGRCRDLEKVALAGNRLRTLPESMAACRSLALLRIAANRFDHLPSWLPDMPALAWLAYGGNPFALPAEDAVPRPPGIPWVSLRLGAQLGQGASGVISVASDAVGRAVAVKVFKGAMTSDGLPESEIAAWLAAGHQPNLIALDQLIADHPGGGAALTMPLIGPSFHRLADPPDFSTCSRDTYPWNPVFSAAQVRRILGGIAAAAAHLHRRGILHGDLYGHNILWDQSGDARLGDFGAACFLSAAGAARPRLERQEVLAFAHLIEDLAGRCPEALPDVRELHRRCSLPTVAERPDMATVAAALAP